MKFPISLIFSGEEMKMIQLSTLGQNRLPAPSIHYHAHDLNDRKQLELMERTGYEIVQRNGQRIYGGNILVLNINLTSYLLPTKEFHRLQ